MTHCRPRLHRLLTVLGVMMVSLLPGPRPTQAFSVFHYTTGGDGELLAVETLQTTGRWSATPGEIGLEDGVEVWVSAQLESELGITDPELKARLREALVESFRVWENDALVFDIHFDQTTTASTYWGGEIDVFAIRQGQYNCASIGGCANVRFDWVDSRLLTNGQSFPGAVISGADLYVVTDFLTSMLSPETFDSNIEIFKQIIQHEIGHTIGLYHPSGSLYNLNMDTDDDPLNEMVFDAADPYVDLKASENFDCAAVMMGITGRCALADDGPRLDDLAGRDALYPVPALAPLAQQLTVLATLAGAHRIRRRRGIGQ